MNFFVILCILFQILWNQNHEKVIPSAIEQKQVSRIETTQLKRFVAFTKIKKEENVLPALHTEEEKPYIQPIPPLKPSSQGNKKEKKYVPNNNDSSLPKENIPQKENKKQEENNTPNEPKGEGKEEEKPAEQEKTLPLPYIELLEPITKNNVTTFEITGEGESEATILYIITDENNKEWKGQTIANAQGTFSLTFNMDSFIDGHIQVQIKQTKNKAISKSVEYSVIKDTTGPTISMEQVKDVIYNNQENYNIKGMFQTEGNVHIEIKDEENQVITYEENRKEKEGYDASLDVKELKNGKLKIDVMATDEYGNIGSIFQKQVVKDSTIYELDQKERTRWNVSNDGTHGIETTKGINDALVWAEQTNIHTFKVLPGRYLIAKGNSERDLNARINMVSNMTFSLDEKATIQKETNGWEIYNTLFLGETVRNVTITGGTYTGDRYTHDYSGKYAPTSGGTHEWGSGIEIKGAEHVRIDNVKLEKFTGDGIEIGGATMAGSLITSQEVEVGSLDEDGNPIMSVGKIRTNNRKVTHFDSSVYQTYRNIFFWVPSGVTSNRVDVYYYKQDGSFIKVDKQRRYYYEESTIPEGADYFRAVFDASSTNDFGVQRMTIANSKHIVIQNSDIGYNRRQGITAGGEHVLIQNNNIHDIGGIPPGAGIDIEPGFMPAIDITIKQNNFDRNRLNMILAYGEDAIIDGNTFGHGGPGSGGVKIWEDFTGRIEVKNNTFRGSGIGVDAPSLVTNNTFIEGEASFAGHGGVVVDGITGIDSSVTFYTKKPMGVIASNIHLTMTGKVAAGIGLEDQPVHLKNVTIKGPVLEKVLGGNVAEGSIFDNLQIIGYNSQKGFTFPRGTYNNCVIEANAENTNIYGPIVNNSGKFEFHHCKFQATRSSLLVYNKDADVTIDNSTFEVMNATGYSFGVVDIQKAKSVTFLNNIIHAEKNTDNGYSLLKLGMGNWQSEPINVGSAVIKGNVLYANVLSNGIHTLDGGSDSLPYEIEDNTLNGTLLKIREKDINNNNQ